MIRIESGDCLSVIPRLVAEGIVCDAVVTDPPYHLSDIGRSIQHKRNGNYVNRGFMGQVWDGGDIAFRPETWATIASILRPGGFLVAFGGTRTHHRVWCAIEDAGFVIQDTICWLYGSGFPKRKDMLKPAVELICLSYKPGGKRTLQISECRVHVHDDTGPCNNNDSIYLSRIFEPQCGTQRILRAWAECGRPPTRRFPNDDECARSLLSAANFPADCPFCCRSRDALISAAQEGDRSASASQPGVLGDIVHLHKEWSHIRANLCTDHRATWDGFLVASSCCTYMQCSRKPQYIPNGKNAVYGDKMGGGQWNKHPLGRWPANVCHDGSDEVLAAFPDAPGMQASVRPDSGTGQKTNGILGTFAHNSDHDPRGDTGSAARFFYEAKAGAEDRWGSRHPTVKPVELLKWLVPLVTPPQGLFLDPFAGSGTAAIAALATGRNAILIEREPQYLADIRERMSFYEGEGRHSLSAKARRGGERPGTLL